MLRKTTVQITIALFALMGATQCMAVEPVTFGYEDPGSPLNEDWTGYEPPGVGQQVGVSDEKAREGSRALKLSGKLPEGFGATYHPWRDWMGYTTLSFDLWVPPSVPRGEEAFDCWVYLKDQSYYWFETPIYADPATLKPNRDVARGRWAHFDIDISATSTAWRPGKHKRSWHHALRNPREFGFRFFGEQDWQGSVYIDNVRLHGQDEVLGKIGASTGARRTPQRWLEPEVSAASVPMYEKFEITFQLNEVYENPFDPDVVRVDAQFVSPSGNNIRVPGFYYQHYERSKTQEGFEKLTPVGAPCWKVRFAPKETGRYTWWVTVQDAAGKMESRPASLQATAPLDPRGYVRVSKQDPLYLEFENGEWFWPVGINMRDGGDDAQHQKGTYDFDYYFKRFHEEGLNMVRTWMCAWWGGIEWSDEYHSRFAGEGWYNLYNAWRMDYCVDLAAQYDLFLEVTFNSHGQVRRDKFDEEWSYSPWNPRNGGYVASPAMFFTDDRVKDAFRDRYRYIIARWGYSRNIMSWDLWNEVDLVEGYDEAAVAAWHQQMAQYLKSIDPWKHITVTHFCLFWAFEGGRHLWELPEIEFVQSDAYWDQNDKKTGDFRTDMGMYSSYRRRTDVRKKYEPIYKKPFVFIEYGPLYKNVADGKVGQAEWQQRFRIGQWTSAVLPTAAAPLSWYHQEWDKLELYRYQKPLQSLFAEHDRRGQGYRMRPVVLRKGGAVRALGMANADEGFFYIHDPKKVALDRAAIKEPTEGIIAIIYHMQPGVYDVQFIDTLTGEETGVAETEVGDKSTKMQFDLPAIADDLLVKVTRRR